MSADEPFSPDYSIFEQTGFSLGLKREEAARTRRAEKTKTPRKTSTRSTNTVAVLDSEATNAASPSEQTHPEPKKAAGKQRRTLNLKTYKDHALGDYVETIRRYGTTDSYSTETARYLSFFFFPFFKNYLYSIRWS